MSGEQKLCCNCKHYTEGPSEASDGCSALVGPSLVRGTLSGHEFCAVMRTCGRLCGPDGVLFVPKGSGEERT